MRRPSLLLGVSRRERHGGAQRGAAAVEFALVLPVLLLLLFGTVQYGLYLWAAQSGSHAVNTAARQMSVGNCQASGALQTLVDGQVGASAAGPATVSPEYANVDGGAASAATVEVGGTVTLTIDFPTIDLNLPLIPFAAEPRVSRTVTARVEDTTDQGCGA